MRLLGLVLVLAASTASADPTEPPSDETDCQQHVVDKAWTEVDACGAELAKRDRAGGARFRRLATAEARAELAAIKIADAIAALDLRTASRELATIPRTSVYHADAKASLAAAQPRGFLCAPGTIDREGGQCTCPMTHSPARDTLDNATCKVDRCRDTAAVAKIRAEADNFAGTGNFGPAVAAYDKILTCQPQVARIAAYLSCKHHQDVSRVVKKYGALLSDKDKQFVWGACHPCRFELADRP